MNVKKLLLFSAIAMGALAGYAQQAEEVTEYEFTPHFYLQGQIGGQETLGEGAFDKLLSPNAQLGIGYQINPLFGLRLSVNGWQSKGVMEQHTNFSGVVPEGKWKWNYIAPVLDLTFNLTNAFGGYNPTRCWDLNLIGGLGANFASKNDDAINYNNTYKLSDGGNRLENIWDGKKTWLVGRVGLGLDFKVTDNFKLGVELQANATSDKYNSKKASNCDWYFNGLVGFKYAFGKTYTKNVVPVVVPVPQIIETITRDTVYMAPQVVEKVEAPAPIEEFTRNVFFKINSYTISDLELQKVVEIAEYMKAHPKAKVHVTGYADKGTGTLAINLRLSRQRAEAVVNALIKDFGISSSRITSSSMTDSLFQPFEEPVLNRVAICVVE